MGTFENKQTEGSGAEFPMSSAPSSLGVSENSGSYSTAEPSQFMSMMAEEKGFSANGKGRILAFAGIAVASLALVAVVFTGEEGGKILDSILGGSAEQLGQPTAPQELPAVPAETAAAEEEEASDPELEPVETEAADETYEYTQVGIDGEYSKEKVWEALKHVDDWRAAGEHDNQILAQYFAHRKVWVRLAALEVAVLQNGLSRDELYSVGKDISDKFNHGQIVRYMKRVRVRDGKTYSEMMKFLQLI